MSGAGTELGKLIPEWLGKQSKWCGCNNWKRKRDQTGIGLFKGNKPMIVQRLCAPMAVLPSPLRVLPVSALRAGAELLVEKAMTNAENSTDQP